MALRGVPIEPHAERLARRRAVRVLAAAALAPLLLTPSGCAKALHEPPPLGDPGPAGASSSPGSVEALLSRAELLYATRNPEEVREAAAVYLEAARAGPGRVEGLVGAARARVWLSDHEPDGAERRRAATEAVQAAQWCERTAPASADCAYWLGAALGVQARERRSTALDALPLIERAFQRAASADPNLDEAGPDRALALLYARAPGWPAGPGDADLAVEHARKAVSLRPGYPPNHLALAEALSGAGAPAESRAAYERALEMARGWAERGDPDVNEWIREAEQALNPTTSRSP